MDKIRAREWKEDEKPEAKGEPIFYGPTRAYLIGRKELCFAFEKLMHEKFQMSSMGELTFFLGLQVKQKKDDGEKVDVHMYWSMISSLMYLTSSRPDIMFAVCACARYQVNPKHTLIVIMLKQAWIGSLQQEVVNFLDVDKYHGSTRNRQWLQIPQQKLRKAKKSVKLMMEKLFRMELELMLIQKPRKPKRKDTQVPQPSDPSENVADKAVHKELGVSLVRAATTASSLEAKQDSGNITKTRSKATPNESSSLGTTLGGGHRCQETTRDTIAQTRFENVSKHSNDSLLARGNTLRSDEDRLKLIELMILCSTLQNMVLDLEKTKTTQQNEIATRVESYGDEESLGKDASKQEMINAIDADEEITLVSVQDDVDTEMFDVDALNGEEVFVVGKNENFVEEVVDVAQVSTTATTITITTEEITLAQALEALKTLKPKVKGIVFQKPGKSTTTTILSSQQSQDKGKGITIEEPMKHIKKKDQISFDEETALKLQAEFNEEERLAREKAKKEQEDNIAFIEEWDDIQVKIDADH
ncbi:hypothetical protein Tco_0591760 [Tanacetum coccineum]